MGTGASKSLANTHGPSRTSRQSPTAQQTADGGVRRTASFDRTATSPKATDGQGYFPYEGSGGAAGAGAKGTDTAASGSTGARNGAHGSPAGALALKQTAQNGAAFGLDGDADLAAPIPVNGAGDGSTNACGGRLGYTPLEAVVGEAGSRAKYTKRRAIGKGAFGEAYIVERNASYDPTAYPLAEQQVRANPLARPTLAGTLYVVKVMDLRNMRLQDRQYAQTEIICLAHCNHFAIISYYEHYVLDPEDETMVIVTEFANHGDLAKNLNRGRATQSLSGDLSVANCSTNNTSISPSMSAGHPPALTTLHLTEKEAGMYFVQILAALHHIHRRRMIHRDVKSANLFLTSHGFLKIGDFGFSQKYESTVSSETVAGTFLGTPYYVSPEMWKGMRYGKKADVWAAGIVLYEMLMDGRRPFEALSLTELKKAVLENDLVLPEYPPDADSAANTQASSPHADGEHSVTHQSPPSETNSATRRTKFSPEIRQLVQSIFQKDPQKRPSTEELLRTPIMQHFIYLFQHHVQSLFEHDDNLRKENPKPNPSSLVFPDPADKLLCQQGVEELNRVAAEKGTKENESGAAGHFEGVVYKGNRDGTWKERYLSLEDSILTISLSSSKAAAEGAERSRKVPANMIKAVSLSNPRDGVTCVQTNQTGYQPPYCFALFMQESNSPIYFGVATEEELHAWMTALMKMLKID